jgi:ubiquinone/menaquinone biosynthesis C-methylase UbiE
MTDLFDGDTKHVLHVAPEPAFEPRMKKQLGAGYVTADLDDSTAMVRMDITDIHYPDESFDVIYSAHVLEHVPDDRKAMREFHRVLRQDGWAILLVPITADTTVEDRSVTDSAERLRLFGQEDHVRRYGPDYRERLEEAGFEVTVTHPSSFLKPDEIERMGISQAAGEIYHCTK